MFESTMECVAAAATLLREGVDALLEADLPGLPGPELLDLLRSVDRQVRRLAAMDARVIAEVDLRHMAVELRARDTETVLGELLLCDRGEARRRVEAARDLGPRLALSGEPLAPLFPVTAAALTDGAISAAHARVVGAVLDRVPSTCPIEVVAGVESTLVEHAQHLRPGQLARAGARLLAVLDPDGPEPVDREHQRRRDLSIHARSDGSATVTGFLTPDAAAVWRTILDSLSAPAPSDEGEPDPRSPGQRRHDAFLDAGMRLLDSGSLPECGGTPLTLVVTMTEQDLRERVGHGSTEHGDVISIAELLRNHAEADLAPVVFDGAGGVVAYGRTRRIASPGQRRALAARDRGCSFPGCDRPPSWCQAHHVVPRAEGGPTDIANLTLVCGHHHRSFERSGWECLMISSGDPPGAGGAGAGGIPHWRPPAWIDPDRKPRRNSAHHVEIEFALAEAG